MTTRSFTCCSAQQTGYCPAHRLNVIGGYCCNRVDGRVLLWCNAGFHFCLTAALAAFLFCIPKNFLRLDTSPSKGVPPPFRTVVSRAPVSHRSNFHAVQQDVEEKTSSKNIVIFLFATLNQLDVVSFVIFRGSWVAEPVSDRLGHHPTYSIEIPKGLLVVQHAKGLVEV